MKDGFYLSTYVSVDKIGNLYELMSNRHDMNMALWKKENDDIKLVRYWELERLTRMKHHTLPFYDGKRVDDAIEILLNKEGLSINDINMIWGSPNYYKSSKCDLVPGYYFHGIAHLFSSIMIDTDIFYNNKILGFSVDLRADNETEKRENYGFKEYVGCYSDCGKIEYFNIASPALLWHICKKEIGLEEGSLMALASATDCHKKNPIKFDEKMMLYSLDYDLGYEIYRNVIENLSIDSVEDINSDFSVEDNLISAAMKEIDRISVLMMEKQISELLSKYSIEPSEIYLGISGGYGLNCPTNSYLMRRFGFKGFLGAPCMNDAGGALGAGLFMFYNNIKKFNFKLQHAFYGNKYDEKDIIDLLTEKGFIDNVSDTNSDTFIEDVSRNVIVWVDAEAEIGPRALGHRSLLGDPRKKDTKDELNRIKCRQFWRPVAPIVLEEFAKEWFEDVLVSPYMLHTSQIREEKLKMIPAVAHLDKSARLQTLNNKYDNNNNLYNMIYAFYEKTGVPILCNTSLNDKGEPIVNRPCEALHFALKKQIKIVYINGKRIELKNFEQYEDESEFEPEIIVELESASKEEQLEKENPMKLSRSVLMWRNIFNEYDYTTDKGAKILERSVELIYEKRPVMKRLFDEENI